MNESFFNTILLGDGRLPTGGYSDSAGLEPAVMAGLKINEVPSYMAARLQTITKMEAAACVLAHRLANKNGSKEQFKELERAVEARTPSPAQRKASHSIGRATLYLTKKVKPECSVVVMLDSLETPPTRGVALGVLAAILDIIDEEHCAQVCCYDDLQRIAEATLKVLPTDPAEVTRWLIKIGKSVPSIVHAACQVNEPKDLPAISAPWMEHWAEEHAQRTKRLFMA